MDHSEYKNKIRKKIRGILQSLLAEEVGLIEGARDLSGLRYELGESFEAGFRYFVTVDSETDHLFLGDKIPVSTSYLSRIESEIQEYQDSERDAKNVASKNLLSLLEER